MGESASGGAPAQNAPAPALLEIRDRINELDLELVELLAARLALVASAAEHKSDHRSLGDPQRVEEVLALVRARAAEYGADLCAIDAVYRVLIDQGIGLETAAYEQRTQRNGVAVSPSAGEATLNAADQSASLVRGNLMSVMATMRAMRRLDDRPVAPELLEKLVQAASWAPIGGNRQDYRFVIVSDRSQLARLAPHWTKAMEFYLGALLPEMSPQESLRFERVHDAMTYQREHFACIPALIVVCCEPVSFWKRLLPRPRRLLRQLWTLSPADRVLVLSNLRRWAHRGGAATVYPAVQNLLLAARAHGLGATLTTWHSAFEQEFKAVLEIPREVDIYAVVPVGYPRGRFGPVRRRPVRDLVAHERWQG